jgi:hypothetical protein
VATKAKRTGSASASKPSWNAATVVAIRRAARAGARSIRGLDDETYADCESEGVSAVIEHSPDLVNAEAYARTAARNAALRQQKLTAGNAELTTAAEAAAPEPNGGPRKPAAVGATRRDELVAAFDHLARDVRWEIDSGRLMRDPERFAGLLHRRIQLYFERDHPLRFPETFARDVVEHALRATSLDPSSGRWVESAETRSSVVRVRGRSARALSLATSDAEHFRAVRIKAARSIAAFGLKCIGIDGTALNRLEAGRRRDRTRRRSKYAAMATLTDDRREPDLAPCGAKGGSVRKLRDRIIAALALKRSPRSATRLKAWRTRRGD